MAKMTTFDQVLISLVLLAIIAVFISSPYSTGAIMAIGGAIAAMAETIAGA